MIRNDSKLSKRLDTKIYSNNLPTKMFNSKILEDLMIQNQEQTQDNGIILSRFLSFEKWYEDYEASY